eukprot:3946625-Amphidinium_carterae.1
MLIPADGVPTNFPCSLEKVDLRVLMQPALPESRYLVYLRKVWIHRRAGVKHSQEQVTVSLLGLAFVDALENLLAY